MLSRQKNTGTVIELWFDEGESITTWDTRSKYNLLLVEHGSISLEVNARPIICAAPGLLFIKQNSRVKFINSTLLKASRISFESVFINVNLTPERICLQEYRQLFRDHHIDKLVLFEDQDKHFFGLLPLSQTVFQRMSGLFVQLQEKLKDTKADHWRCNVRDPLLAILTLAEVVHKDFIGKPTFLPTDKEPAFYVSTVTEFLHANYPRKIKIDELCDLVKVNRDELSRQFKAYTFKTITQYLMDCRLHHTVDLLLSTELTLYAISRECGFNSESYFVRMFTREFKMSPTEFRNIHVGRRKAALNKA